MMLDPITRKLWQGAGHNGLLCLMYHSITAGKKKPDWQWALSLNDFCDHLDLLLEYGWRTIGPDDLTNGSVLPAKSVLITFDDGYADNYAAFEALAKRNMQATWFIVTRDIGKMSNWRDDGCPSLPMLTGLQLNEMKNAGMVIGSHTHTHCRLTEQSSEQIGKELRDSRTLLSELLQNQVNSFAYPYGLYDETIRAYAETCGYKVAFTTRSGFGLVNADTLQVRRLAIMADDSLSRFARKLTFASNDVNWSSIAEYAVKRIKQRIKR